MSGDRHADVYLDVDANGKPTNCRLGKNNLLGDARFWVCRAYMEQWSTQPPAGGAPTTVQRVWTEYGARHVAAENAARAKYFAEHPDERSQCYPQSASSGQIIRDPPTINAARSQ